jgi:hypothetical protein
MHQPHFRSRDLISTCQERWLLNSICIIDFYIALNITCNAAGCSLFIIGLITDDHSEFVGKQLLVSNSKSILEQPEE